MENTKPPLDEGLYDQAIDEDLSFIKSQIGIQDPQELKHVLGVQKKACSLHAHHCIRSFAFTRPKIQTLPAYERVLALGRERQGAIFLDLGCCFGTDIRKVASDGFPMENLIACDLRPGFWDLGHELFRSTSETCPIAFVAGDAFDATFLEPCAPFSTPAEVVTPVPMPLTSLTTLTPLRGHVSAIHTSAVFHLFLEPQQLQLARALAGLLSPTSGSVIFGSHVAREQKGFRQGSSISSGHRMFCHSPESWCEMWEEVFPRDSVKVEAQLVARQFLAIKDDEITRDARYLVWSVTRN